MKFLIVLATAAVLACGSNTKTTATEPCSGALCETRDAGPGRDAGTGGVGVGSDGGPSTIGSPRVDAGPANAEDGGATATADGGPSADGGAVVTADGGAVVTADGGAVVTADGGAVVTADGGAVVTADGGAVVAPDGGVVVTPDGGAVVTPDGGVVVPADGGAVANRCAGVVCTARDTCHNAGACDPATGACSSPAKANGEACDDGNATTTNDRCSAGTCVGTNPNPTPTPGSAYVRIEPGTFMMGSPEDEPGRYVSEPLHQVTITRPYFLKRTELTQADWVAVMGYNPAGFLGCGLNCPVESITWFESVAFLNALSIREGFATCYTNSADGTPYDIGDAWGRVTPVFLGLDCAGYRLPTEAEREYAARAGTRTPFYNGPITYLEYGPLDPRLDRVGYYAANSEVSYADGYPCQDWMGPGRKCGSNPVATKEPNAWGLYDMHGNVWEWTNDWYQSYGTAPRTDPTGGSSGIFRANRGGGWALTSRMARCAFRGFGKGPEYSSTNVGFRPARTIR